MSDRFQIPALEHGIVRLFTVNLSADEIPGFSERGDIDGNASWPLQDALGIKDLDEEFVEVFAIDDLEDFGLTGYMIEGLGIAEDDISRQRAQLNAIKGFVLIVYSAAFKGIAQALSPKAPLRWIGTYVEDREPVTFAPLPADSAKGNVPAPAKASPSDAAMSGRVATIALLIMFALVGVMIWVAA